MAAAKTTPLIDLHMRLGGKLVDFAGYSLPVQYATGIIKEHLHTRSAAGLFDVSHMGQLVVSGDGAAQRLEAMLPIDAQALTQGKQTYTLLMNDVGGIIDDLIVTRWADDTFYLVVNAARLDVDLAVIREHLSGLEVEHRTDRALLALQGPAAVSVLADFAPELQTLPFMQGVWQEILGVECFVSRSGYTGEDGFELSIPGDSAEAIAQRLLENTAVKPIGLGARDTLRLEAGLCLYGHDLDESVSPVEAGLSWSIAKARRSAGERAGGFPGAERYFSEAANGPSRRRVGLAIQRRAPVREGAQIIGPDDKELGNVSSGGFSPSLDKPVAMGYVNSEALAAGTPLRALHRGRSVDIAVSRLPFVEQRYYRGK